MDYGKSKNGDFRMKPICGYSQCESFHWWIHPDLDEAKGDMVGFIEERVKECMTCNRYLPFKPTDNFKEMK